MASGTPVLMYAYEHGLGRTLNVHVAGRGGGWKTQNSPIEGVMNALLEISQDADNLLSQILTYIRATMWPTFIAKYDPEARGGDGELPKPPQIKEGEIIPMWKTEELEPVFKPQPFPMVEWSYNDLRQRISELSGSASVFGQHQPGVTTGYHEQSLMTQAEHLDNQIEFNAQAGAVDGAILLLTHIKAKDEPVPVLFRERREDGRRAGKFLWVDPKSLSPMPHLTAKVKDPTPQDFAMNVRQALDATMDRNGRGPLVSDVTARENIMGLDAPDDEEMLIYIQDGKRELIKSGRFNQDVGQKIGLLMVTQGQPQATPGQAQNADPALIQAMQQQDQQGVTVTAGGVSPQTALAQQSATPGGPSPYTGRGGGLPTGQAQPNQQLGRATELLQSVTNG